MKFDEDMSAIHGYLCADGYVIRNRGAQKHKFYHIGLRNTNTVLLVDFQKRFERRFGVRPFITNEGRCRIQNKEIYHELTNGFSFYSGEWNIPDISKDLLKLWLRSYFDCDGWVSCRKGKSREIGLDSINKKGIIQIRDALYKFGIASNVKERKNREIWRLYIYGKDNILKFRNAIGFLHPDKKSTLEEAIESYESYVWIVPKDRNELMSFIDEKGRKRVSSGERRFFSILKDNLSKLQHRLSEHGIKSNIYGPWKSNWGTEYYCLSVREDNLKKLGG
jgi:hypothetical protein